MAHGYALELRRMTQQLDMKRVVKFTPSYTPVSSEKRIFRRLVEKQVGEKLSGRQWRKKRKEINKIVKQMSGNENINS